jgi:hypothetical protein
MFPLGKPDGGEQDKHATLVIIAGKMSTQPSLFSIDQGGEPLKISRAWVTSAALLSAVFLLAGCGHGLINRLI